MSIKASLRKLFFGLTLAMASMTGVAMRPEQVEEIMRDMNVPKIVHVLDEQDNTGDDPIPPTSCGEPPGSP